MSSDRSRSVHSLLEALRRADQTAPERALIAACEQYLLNGSPTLAEQQEFAALFEPLFERARPTVRQRVADLLRPADFLPQVVATRIAAAREAVDDAPAPEVSVASGPTESPPTAEPVLAKPRMALAVGTPLFTARPPLQVKRAAAPSAATPTVSDAKPSLSASKPLNEQSKAMSLPAPAMPEIAPPVAVMASPSIVPELNAEDTELPTTSTAAFTDAALRFLEAIGGQRRLILEALLPKVPTTEPVTSLMITERDQVQIITTAMARQIPAFFRALGEAAGLGPALTRKIATDGGGEPLLIALKAIGLHRDAIVQVLLSISAAAGRSATPMHHLAALEHQIDRDTATRMLRAWQRNSVAPTAFHKALHSSEAVTRSVARQAASIAERTSRTAMSASPAPLRKHAAGAALSHPDARLVKIIPLPAES